MRALCTLTLSALLVLSLTRAAVAEPPAPPGTTVTLLTGHQVFLSPNASATVRPAKGRERVPVTRYRENGHLYVVPSTRVGSSRPAGSTRACST